MRAIYIFDTSALIHDPFAWKQFSYCDIIIPIAVLNELDKLKKHPGEVGKNARVCIRALDELSDGPDITTGVMVGESTLLKIDANYQDLKDSEFDGFGDPHYGDTQILACAVDIYRENPGADIFFVSNDINLRIKAKARGLHAIPQDNEKQNVSEIYPGFITMEDEVAGLDLQRDGFIDSNKNGFFHLQPHEGVLFTNDKGEPVSLGRSTSNGRIRLVKKYFPWSIGARNQEQAFAMDLIMDKKIDLVTLIGGAGTGKTLVTLASALEMVISKREYDKFIIYRPIQPVGNDIGYLPGPQPLTAKILTPNGWTTMGQLKVGDLVIARDGKPTKVLNIFPKGTKSVYSVTTSDQVSTECCEDHLWEVEHQNKKSVVPTKYLMENTEQKFYLPRNSAVEYTPQSLPFPPYALGALIGDGSVRGNHVTYFTKDQEIIDRVEQELKPFNCRLVQSETNELSYRFYPMTQQGKAGAQNVLIIKDQQRYVFDSLQAAAQFVGIKASSVSRNCHQKKAVNHINYSYLNSKMGSSHPMINVLNKLGIYQKVSHEKFIPKQYLYSSIEDRVNLLRGLLDTDGTIKNNGEISFCTTSKQLAEDVIELVRSLGGRSSLRTRNRIGKSNISNNKLIKCKRLSYEFTISLPSEINPFFLSRKAMKHNPKRTVQKPSVQSIEYVGEKEVQCILLDHPEHLYVTDNFIVTHNTMEEKLAPWFHAIMDNFEVLFSNKVGDWRRDLEMFQKKGKIEMEAITYIRGRSIPNAIILIDEAQNLSKEEIKTVLTRAGEGTKIILTGDIEQIDNSSLDASNNGLTYAIEKFKSSDIAGHITFTKGERSRLATEAARIL